MLKGANEKKYGIDVRECYTSFDEHFDTSKKFGYFSEDGKTYTVTDKNTPRQWLSMLYNDRFASIVSNKGEGYTVFGGFYNRITKYFNPEFYIVRDIDGKRILEVYDCDTGETVDLFNSSTLLCHVRAGSTEFEGYENGIEYKIRIFVPTDATCECWLVEIRDTSGKRRNLRIHAQTAWTMHNRLSGYGKRMPSENMQMSAIEGGFAIMADDVGKPFGALFGGFAISGYTNGYFDKKVESTLTSKKKDAPLYKNFNCTYVNLYSDITLEANGNAERVVVSGASSEQAEVGECMKLLDVDKAEKAYAEVLAHYEREFDSNTCNIPDKNFERFLNTWLKYQLGLTYIYNRNSQNGGFRDVLQDSWGAMLIRPDYSKRRTLEALSHVYADGRSMRGYDSYAGVTDSDDFVDCPIWAPCTVAQYVKETGDSSILDIELPYFKSDEVGTVEDHLWRMLEYPYEHRGANGLVLMRDGDWLDGLTGINQNGTATSAWATMQAYWAQNILAELYDACGRTDKAAILRERSAEYKEIVRRVAWDGKWYVYGFKSDGLPVGSSKCKEGKIYLNPQSWAIFTGIEDDPARIAKIRRSVNTYLTTVFGPMILYPPYVNDKTCGRISGQVPGSFANAAIYLHAASFKVYSDIAAGEYDEAYDTFMRLLPNHVDNSDTRRTSEPWCTGNVHFGPDNPCFGMNLFSWFTATPAWLIHGGFGRILGVEAEYDGLHVNPHVPEDWNEYSVKRTYREKVYTLTFRRAENGEQAGIYKDGKYLWANVIPKDADGGEYSVIY